MKLADSLLGLTYLSGLDEYLELTDEVVLHSLVTLKPSSQSLREARCLAIDFRDRNLVKCAFEEVVLRREHMVARLFVDEMARARTVSEISRASRVNSRYIYLDVPTVPSVPYTYTKETLTAVGLLRAKGNRRTVKKVPLSQLPLVGSIAGFMDVLRVYTTAERRAAVEQATSRLFGNQGFAADIAGL